MNTIKPIWLVLPLLLLLGCQAAEPAYEFAGTTFETKEAVPNVLRKGKMKTIKTSLLTLTLLLLLAACGSSPAAGELEITDITANLALPTDTGALYMLITNNTAEDDALIGAAVPGCGTIELHEMSMEDDVMIMGEVDGGQILIPAGETVTLKRGGLHVMCIDKAEPTAAGEIVPVTLEFANAGTVEVEAEAIDIAGGEMDMEHGEMEEMDMEGDESMEMEEEG